MSDPRDKADPDPDATVSMPPRKTAPKDDDATVMMPSHKGLEASDEDATVTMGALKGLKDEKKDEDATVAIPPGGLKAAEAAAETAAAMGSPREVPAAFRTEVDPDATVAGTSPPPAAPALFPIAAEPSRMPMIAGGIVVLLVVLYFVFGGGQKETPPVASNSASTATPAAPAASAPALIPAPAASTPARAPAAASAGQAKAKDALAAEIKRGTVVVAEEGGGTTITLANTHQFASGGTDSDAKVRPVLLGIAAALDKVPGAIVVTGHADATPSSNPKFPSNQELSAARGGSVAKLMASKLSDPKRVTSEGASDSKPLAPSDTQENRAKNRRVVIVVKPAS